MLQKKTFIKKKKEMISTQEKFLILKSVKSNALQYKLLFRLK